jgi:hypothetical protein
VTAGLFALASSPLRAILLLAAAALAFALLVTFNSGGYRYGASDQAFYIPAILEHLDPTLFPRDWSLLEPQARYFLLDEIVARGIRSVGGSVESWFLAGYVATCAVLFASLTALGAAVFRSPLAVAAFVTAGTLRHRITKTGVNTFEGYFHPRVLVFALGVAAIVLYLRGRVWWALAVVLVGGLLHPSTAAFFVVLIGVAAWVTDPPARPGLASLAVVAAGAAAWLLIDGPWRGALRPMDPEWRALLAVKDYLFPLETWPPTAWLVNAGTAGIAVAGLSARIRTGAAHPRERGLLAGAVVLLIAFLLTLPGVAMGSALLVQLQINRIFWLLELLALVPVVWWLVDRPAARTERRWAALAIVCILAAASLARGVWTSWVERRGEVFSPSLASSDWTRALGWVDRHAPPDAHILADPGHAWKYGSDVRFVGHDVYLEEVKDTSMALYSRAAASRVIERIRDLGPFDLLTEPHAHALAKKYDLDYLIATTSLDLPLEATEGRFRIYRLQP